MAAKATRVAVVIDWQNAYKSALDAFGPGTRANFYPYALAERLARDRRPGQSPPELVAVEIHTGIPSQKQNATSHAARRRQIAAWERVHPCVRVHPRTLVRRDGALVEKGVDVAIAIDVVRHSLFSENPCDVVVLMSADTDLLPAIELVVAQRGPEAVEVATWDGPHWATAPLSLAGHTIRQHRLSEAVHRSIADPTRYQLPIRER